MEERLIPQQFSARTGYVHRAHTLPVEVEVEVEGGRSNRSQLGSAKWLLILVFVD